MSKRFRKWTRRPIRIDRRFDDEPAFDLELLQRGLKESLLVARLFRRPAKYLRGRSGAAR